MSAPFEDFPEYESKTQLLESNKGVFSKALGSITQAQKRLLLELQAEHPHTLEIEITKHDATSWAPEKTMAMVKSKDKNKIAWVEYSLQEAHRKAKKTAEMRAKLSASLMNTPDLDIISGEDLF